MTDIEWIEAAVKLAKELGGVLDERGDLHFPTKEKRDEYAKRLKEIK